MSRVPQPLFPPPLVRCGPLSLCFEHFTSSLSGTTWVAAPPLVRGRPGCIADVILRASCQCAGRRACACDLFRHCSRDAATGRPVGVGTAVQRRTHWRRRAGRRGVRATAPCSASAGISCRRRRRLANYERRAPPCVGRELGATSGSQRHGGWRVVEEAEDQLSAVQ